MIALNLEKSLGAGPRQLKLKLDFSFEKGSFITLFGPSGAGKTSTLRLISGLMRADRGFINISGNYWYDSGKKVFLKASERKIGYVFQDYALFPNMTVLGNLRYALGSNKPNPILEELIEITGLEDLRQRMPDSLSGGEKQRVALARAMVRKPEVLLLDEPFSALDPEMRSRMQEYILKVHRRYGLTTILVSHDIGEIVKLSDYIYELQEGKVVRAGKVADFFGLDNSSAKFRFTGEIVDIVREGVVYILGVGIGNDIVRVIADPSEGEKLSIGDKVSVASKAFNPMIRKIKGLS